MDAYGNVYTTADLYPYADLNTTADRHTYADRTRAPIRTSTRQPRSNPKYCQ